jgi:hypothetical protein
MVAMRSASEQQLARDCLSGVDACDRRDIGNSPSVEVLMTLLWTIDVIDKERRRESAKLDAATEVRQACRELEALFGQRDVEQRKGSFVSRGSGTTSQKFLDGRWRMAFKHEDSH